MDGGGGVQVGSTCGQVHSIPNPLVLILTLNPFLLVLILLFYILIHHNCILHILPQFPLKYFLCEEYSPDRIFDIDYFVLANYRQKNYIIHIEFMGNIILLKIRFALVHSIV